MWYGKLVKRVDPQHSSQREICFLFFLHLKYGLSRWLSGRESDCQYRRHRRCQFDPWVGKTPWRRKWNWLQYYCLGNPMDRGGWQATVRGIAESDRTEQLSTHASKIYKIMDVNQTYCGHHFTKYVNRIIILYILKVYSDVCSAVSQ